MPRITVEINDDMLTALQARYGDKLAEEYANILFGIQKSILFNNPPEPVKPALAAVDAIAMPKVTIEVDAIAKPTVTIEAE